MTVPRIWVTATPLQRLAAVLRISPEQLRTRLDKVDR